MRISFKQIEEAAISRQRDTIDGNKRNSRYILVLWLFYVGGSIFLVGYLGMTPIVLVTLFIALLLTVISSLLLTISTNLITSMRQNDDQRLLLLAALPDEIPEQQSMQVMTEKRTVNSVAKQVTQETAYDYATRARKKFEKELVTVFLVAATFCLLAVLVKVIKT